MMESDRMSFWRGKKVFITGHTGFKGGWLSLWLQSLGADLVGYALPPSAEPNFFTLTDVSSSMTSILGDLRDFSSLTQAIKIHQPEIVIHLAAQSLVRYSYQHPIETYTTNVIGTVNLLEACRHVTSVKSIINVTTDKCYENNEWVWGYRENDTLGGNDPYSNSKACSEMVTTSYRKSYFSKSAVGLASVRAGNVIGGGDWARDRLIPDIIMACENQEPVLLRYPNAVRPWQHVLEPLSGYLLLAERLYERPDLYAESWNFGPNVQDVRSVHWVTKYLLQHLNNKTLPVDGDKDQQPHEATSLMLDCSKAKAKLGWHPHWGIEKALTETIKWHQAYRSDENIRDYTLQQINHFMSERMMDNSSIKIHGEQLVE